MISLVCSAVAHAADEPALEVACLPDRPVVFEGESVELQAWASAAGKPALGVSVQWVVKRGSVSRQAAQTRWDLSHVALQGQEKEVVVAAAQAQAPGFKPGECRLEVIVARHQLDIPEPSRGTIVLTGRSFLLPKQKEEPNYGLYSYFLLYARPKDQDERERYLAAMESFLLTVQDINDLLARHVPRSQLNIGYVPVNRVPKQAGLNRQLAETVLDAYDYAGAQVLLARLGKSNQQGPYLAAVLRPLRDDDQTRLFEDLSGVAPKLAPDWIKFFMWLTAQERGWTSASLRRLGLNLRNVIAAGGAVTPELVETLPKLIRFVEGKP